MKAKTPEPLKRVRLWKTLMRLSQWCALAFLAGSIYFFRSAQYRYGWALAAIAVIVGALLALPAAFAYRRQWTQQSIEAGMECALDVGLQVVTNHQGGLAVCARHLQGVVEIKW